METIEPKIEPEDLIVVRDFGNGPQVFTNARGVLGEQASRALLEWQHNTVNKGENWEARAEAAGVDFMKFAGFRPEDVEAAQEAKLRELRLR